MTDLQVTVDGTILSATWTDDSPSTRAAVRDALPLAGDATRWGDELYFRVPVEADRENAREVVEPGAIAYWPQGPALCLFWGPTPASTDDRPRAASPVNVVARIEDVGPLAGVEGDATVRIEEA